MFIIDEKKRNNSFSSAESDMDIGKDIVGHIGIDIDKNGENLSTGISDKDFYQYTLDSSGILEFSLDHDNSQRLEMKVYNSDKRLLASISNTSDDIKNLIAVGGETGDYYVMISGFSQDGTYTLTSSIKSDPRLDYEIVGTGNGTIDTASTAHLGKDMVGKLCGGISDTDYYKYTLDSSGKLNIAINHDNTHEVTVSIFHADTQIESESSKNDFSFTAPANNTGDYYIKVSGFNEEGIYTLSVDDGTPVDGTTEQQSYSSAISFSAKDASLYGSGAGLNLTKTFDNLVAKFKGIDESGTSGIDINAPLNLNLDAAINYNLKVSDIQVGVPIKLALTAGVFDFSYPLNASVSMPKNIDGDSNFTVRTDTVDDASAPTMKVTGPNASIKAETLIQAKIDADASMDWNVSKWNGTKQIFSVHDTLSTPTVTLFDYSADKLDPEAGLKLNQNLKISKETFGGSKVYRNPFFELSTKFKSNGLDGVGKSVVDSDGLYDISAELQQKDPMFNLKFDIDDTLGTLTSLIPHPATAAAGKIISKLDGEYRANYPRLEKWLLGDWKTDFEYSIMSVNADLGISPEMKIDLDVKRILATLTPSWDLDHPQTKELGESFEFTAPANPDGASIDAVYTMEGTVTTKAGLSVDGNIELKFLGFDDQGKVLGFDMPTIFPDGDADNEKETYLSDSLGEFSWPEDSELTSFDWEVASFPVSYQSIHNTYFL